MNMPKVLLAFCLLLFTTSIFAATGDAETAEGFQIKPFLGPFHTVTLHLPIGILALAILLEMWAMRRPSEELREAIGISLWAGFAGALVATLLGLALAEGGGYDPHNVEMHERTGIAVSVVTGLIAIFHTFLFRAKSQKPRLVLLYRVLLLADMGLLAVAGHYGGNLTHGSTYLTENGPDWFQKVMGEYDDESESAEENAGIYAEVIVPIFEEKCYSCHGEEKQKGDYRMDTVEGLFTAGDSEIEPITKGNAMTSYLIESILLPEDDEFVMPPEGKERLTQDEIMLIINWVWNGAKT